MQAKIQTTQSEALPPELEYSLEDIAKIYCGEVTERQHLESAHSLRIENDENNRTRIYCRELVQNKL